MSACRFCDRPAIWFGQLRWKPESADYVCETHVDLVFPLSRVRVSVS